MNSTSATLAGELDSMSTPATVALVVPQPMKWLLMNGFLAKTRMPYFEESKNELVT